MPEELTLLKTCYDNLKYRETLRLAFFSNSNERDFSFTPLRQNQFWGAPFLQSNGQRPSCKSDLSSAAILPTNDLWECAQMRPFKLRTGCKSNSKTNLTMGHSICHILYSLPSLNVSIQKKKKKRNVGNIHLVFN